MLLEVYLAQKEEPFPEIGSSKFPLVSPKVQAI